MTRLGQDESGPSPQLLQCLREMRERTAPFNTDDTFDVAAFRAATRAAQPVLPVGLEVRRERLGNVDCLWVRREDADPDARLVYFHGGGGISGSFEAQGGIACWLAELSRCSVLFAEYRLAPEHPFPAGLDDAAAVLEVAWRHGPNGETSARTVGVCGASAGAALALGAVQRLRARGGDAKSADVILVLCPMLDWDETRAEALRQSKFRREMARAYVGSADSRDPLLSPLYSDLAGLPPLYVQAGGNDEFVEDARQLASRARDARVDVRLDLWPGLPHAWQRFSPTAPEAVQALAAAARHVDAWLEPQPANE